MSNLAPLEAVFFAALEKGSPEERAAYLDQACGDDAELRRRLEKMLAAQSQAESFLERPASAVVATVDQPVLAKAGTVIGPYTLLEQIGEGGFGVVFMAEQTRPVRRKVALKVLKPGMDTRQVIARFEAERQALALMDHVNIAKVLEAGETSSGRPYFAMELVRGVAITDYCDQNRFSTRQRLELFVTVCQAVQHAHQKGIIHRDIKPSNVLVALYDSAAVVKVIDFGIAKAIGQQLTEKTMCTGAGQLVGTPLYMSPEQADLNGLDIDTRSDIYSLGVLLYELLTGMTPFDKERLRAAGYDEMRRIIRDEEPSRPSTRLSTLGPAAATVSERRQSDPRRLSQLVRGELDWIVMKALEKDRNRRYETASAFAADVERYLHDEPVEACPPSAWYRFGKFARRKRGALAMALVIVAALGLATAAIGGSIGWAVRDHDAREAAIAGDRAMREAALDQQVERDCDEAAALIDGVHWPAAAVPLVRAEKLLAAAGRQTIPTRLRELQRDLVIGRRVDDILQSQFIPSVQHEYYTRALPVALPGISPFISLHDKFYGQEWVLATNVAYGSVFKDYDIDVATLTVADAAQCIRTRSIRVRLASALDSWSSLNRAHSARPDWKHLLEVAKAVDSDPWRNQLRDMLQQLDWRTLATPAQRQAIEALVASANIRDLPPETLLLMGETMGRTGTLTALIDFQRKAQRQYPDNVRINTALAWCCYITRQYDEAVRSAALLWSLARTARTSVYASARRWSRKGRSRQPLKSSRGPSS